jgi:hypothetical protein
MTSLPVKRLIAGFVGLVYAVIYGFWTMLLTGGGHGNFIWFMMFLLIEFFGLYFPLMAAMAANLRSVAARTVFGAFIAFNLITSSVMIYGWVTEAGENGKPSDFSKMVQISGIESILFFAGVHFLPTFVFLFFLIRSIIFGSSSSDEETTVLSLS